MTLKQAPQKGEKGYGLYMWFIEQSESGADIDAKHCPTCGDHDCQGGLPCETGDGA